MGCNVACVVGGTTSAKVLRQRKKERSSQLDKSKEGQGEQVG